MTDSKPWYFSKTIWASLIAGAAAIGSVLGIEIDDATQVGLTDIVIQAVTVIASIFAIFGRLAATSRIEG